MSMRETKTITYKVRDVVAFPSDLLEPFRSHGDPFAWWVGQFVKYVTRPNDALIHAIERRRNLIGFQSPVVGMHVRRTDKLKVEAKYYSVEEYMNQIEEYFRKRESVQAVYKRRVFVATDDLSVLPYAKQRYPNYEFVVDPINTAARRRYSKSALLNVIVDIHLLSRCDFVVATFSSNIGRTVYELKQALHRNASSSVVSLDRKYFFDRQIIYRKGTVIMTHVPPPEGTQIELALGDVIVDIN
jgi:glycoprotein 6-alpha-L-fucosyltransferase